jgi:hypothetical protein
MVSERKNIKEELKEENEEEELEEEEVQTQKIELVEEAKSDELQLPFQREKITNYMWKLLIVRRAEIRDVVFKKTNNAGQVSLIDGWIIDDDELENKVLEKISNDRALPIDMVKEINAHKRDVYLVSSSQGVYYSLLRNIIPKLKNGSVIVGIAYQQSDYPQPMVVLVHPSQLLQLKAQYEAWVKSQK